MNNNLYLVTLRGLKLATTGPTYGIAYVVSADPTSAYAKVKADLEKRDLGFPRDRVLESVELIAEAAEMPECGFRLYLSDSENR